MASKYVIDTKAAKSLSAYIIFKDGKNIARVLAHFSGSGNVLVNVNNYGDTNKDAEEKGFQAGRAGGYGYDKFTAALSGLTIDGVGMLNHSTNAATIYPDDQPPYDNRPDVSGANWRKEDNGYTSWHVAQGLKRLELLGYEVVQVI